MAIDPRVANRAEREQQENFAERFDDQEWLDSIDVDPGEDLHGEGVPLEGDDKNNQQQDDNQGDDQAAEDALEEAIDDAVDGDSHDSEDTGEGEEQQSTDQDDILGDDIGKVEFNERQQQILEKAVGRQVGRRKEVEEENQKLRQQLEQFQRTGVVPGTSAEPVVPELPAAWDPDHDLKMKERDNALIQHAQWQQEQQYAQQQLAERQHAAMQREHQEQVQNAQRYQQRMIEFGIKPEEMQRAAQMVMSTGPNPNTLNYIVAHDSGPKITQFLARNPAVLERLNTIDPMKAVALLETKIVPHLNGQGEAGKKQQQRSNNRPPPINRPKGKGVDTVAQQDRGVPQGTTFE